jgi:hypothetical protein
MEGMLVTLSSIGEGSRVVSPHRMPLAERGKGHAPASDVFRTGAGGGQILAAEIRKTSVRIVEML